MIVRILKEKSRERVIKIITLIAEFLTELWKTVIQTMVGLVLNRAMERNIIYPCFSKLNPNNSAHREQSREST